MNHKRRSRRRDKRTLLPCGCCEDLRGGKNAPRADDSEVCNGRLISKRKTPKKAHCPSGGSHEWVHEQRVEHGSEITHRSGYWACDDCESAKAAVCAAYNEKWKPIAGMGEKVPWHIYHNVRCDHHNIKRDYTINIKASLCLKCGKEVEKAGKRVYLDGHGDYYHGVRRYIPSRDVKV